MEKKNEFNEKDFLEANKLTFVITLEQYHTIMRAVSQNEWFQVNDLMTQLLAIGEPQKAEIVKLYEVQKKEFDDAEAAKAPVLVASNDSATA